MKIIIFAVIGLLIAGPLGAVIGAIIGLAADIKNWGVKYEKNITSGNFNFILFVIMWMCRLLR